MAGAIDPSGLPRWFLLIVLAVVIAGALSQGLLDAGYNVFGTSIATMNIAGILFAFGVAMMIVAYAKWI